MSGRNTVVHIVSLGHSGSTLLGHVLGGHANVLHIGEIVSPIRKGFPILCRSCGADCPVWQEDMVEVAQKEYGLFEEFGLSLTSSGKLYDALFNKCGEMDVIVDGTKNVHWARFQQNDRFDNKYVFLLRNKFAVACSFNRAYRDLYSGLLYKIRLTWNGIWEFYSEIEDSKKFIIEYEEYTTAPEMWISKLCTFLGIEIDSDMLDIGSHTAHIFGGNVGIVVQTLRNISPGRAMTQAGALGSSESREYNMKVEGIDIDDRWKTELSRADREYIEAHLTLPRLDSF